MCPRCAAACGRTMRPHRGFPFRDECKSCVRGRCLDGRAVSCGAATAGTPSLLPALPFCLRLTCCSAGRSRTRHPRHARAHRHTHPQVQAKEVKRVCEGRCGWLCKRGLQNTSLQRRWCGRYCTAARITCCARVACTPSSQGSSRGTLPAPRFLAREDLRRGRSDGVPRNRCAIHDLHLYYFENPRGEEPLGVVSLRGLFPLCFLRSDVRLLVSDSNRCLHILRSDCQQKQESKDGD